ncbi:mechanosensitive ion channel family protein [Granulicella mallensis]|uniref:Small conductance mechanosensitive channel n=1 Tax=Granulicella mallensis TaxID=940614 RepID=A0A7W7ZT59_9BACT|nr:mechanosensitive ion channel family protein [Granulicella mallensis]MBB5065694.1 small conductance mechanosensitive channel [Granulicella mallensis]
MPFSKFLPFRTLEDGWHTDLLSFLQRGVPKILLALIIALFFQQVVSFFVKRMRKHADRLVGNSQRAAQLRTAAGIIRATAYSLLGFYIFIQTLDAIGFSLAPFIASAGVIGLGISFGAQSIFKDMLTGVFILIEDQYNIGDVVKVAGLQGTVESLTLRCTTLRDGDGTLYIVPNSQIATVSNLSRDFSVATLTVSVDTQVNPDRVMALLTRLATDLKADEAFHDVIIADPQILGVDKINGHEVLYPINLRVRANQRDGVLRELRRRVLIAFNKENIPFGTSSSTLVFQKADPTAPPAATSGLPG